jgi:hypothetical protein
MASSDYIYRRTQAGQSAWESRAPLPTPLRRVLGIVEVDTHSHVLRRRLREHQESAVTDWLSQLERLGLLEKLPSHLDHDLDFTGNFGFRK